MTSDTGLGAVDTVSVLDPWRKGHSVAHAKSIGYRRTGAKADWTVFPYTKLVWVHYQPSTGIIVHYSTHTVFIRGVRLFPLFTQIRDQLISEVVHDSMADEDDDGESPVITRIQITQKGRELEPFLFPDDPES